jgi:hypothetical protein
VSEETIDKLAGRLYEAYEPGSDGWEDLKQRYPSLGYCWLRVAEEALAAIVVVTVRP